MLKQLKLLFQDFFHFAFKDFHPIAYGYTLIMIAASITFVYCSDIGKSIAYNNFPTSNNLSNNILMFVVLYFLVAVPVAIFQGKFRNLPKPVFFLKGIFLMSLIGFADAFSWQDILGLHTLSSIESSYIFKALWRMRNVIFVLPSLIMLRMLMDKDVKGLYGLCSGNHHVKAYLCLYVIILPLLIAVSFTPDFLSYYPVYKPWAYMGAFEHPVWLNTLIFETIYISDFLMVELIFRGALVIGMMSLLGRSAVLPMVMVYVALHFGKPVMETISAMFGGYFLGALAFQTRHIWGGVIIHMGIALIIELLRFFHHYVLGVA